MAQLNYAIVIIEKKQSENKSPLLFLRLSFFYRIFSRVHISIKHNFTDNVRNLKLKCSTNFFYMMNFFSPFFEFPSEMEACLHIQKVFALNNVSRPTDFYSLSHTDVHTHTLSHSLSVTHTLFLVHILVHFFAYVCVRLFLP